jgi:4-amino-4-deoxy-L-arabinose transferase-like glycosyltransferase
MKIRPEEHAGTTTPNSASFDWRLWLFVLSTAAVLCSFNLGGARSLTEHEIQIGAGAKEMAIDHDWLVPKIGGRPFLEKPPLPDWLAIAGAKIVGGFSETAVRLPSVVAGIGVVAVMTALALRWFGRRVAIFTALAQTTTVYFITYARLAEADMLLAFFVTLALYVFARWQSIGWASSPPRHLGLLFWALVGTSNMAKGLGFGPVLILAPCVAYLALQRDRAAWRRMISWPGFALALIIAVAWPALIALRAPHALELWRGEIGKRAAGAADYEQPWYYYVTTAPWQLLPWTPALLLAIKPSLKRAWYDAQSADRFIWCWAIAPIVLLSFFHGKHHHYIISALPALSPLFALGLLRFGTRWAAACVGFAAAGVLFVHARVLLKFDRSHDDREFLLSVRRLIPGNAPLAAVGGLEVARHIFYVDPPPQIIWSSDDLRQHFHDIPFFLITRRNEEPELQKLGRIQVIAQSRRTRKERDPSDRFTLFRIQPSE